MHVVDITHPNAIEQANSVIDTLKNIGAEHIPTVTVLNKIDRLPQPELTNELLENESAVGISALKGINMDELLRVIEGELFENFTQVTVEIPYTEGQLISLFHEQGQVVLIEHKRKGVFIQGHIPGRLLARYQPYQNISSDKSEEMEELEEFEERDE